MAFADHLTQGPAVELLQRSLKSGRLGHAYLFHGDDPAELEHLARTLGKAVNCTATGWDDSSGVRADCCDRCSSCHRIQRETHPDVLWVRPESKSRTIRIEQIREVIHSMNLRPAEARWKVGVISGADRMRAEAANAFLKTLEEPPGRSVLILLSTHPHRMLETLLSRCLRLSLSSGMHRPAGAGQERVMERFATLLSRPSTSLLGRYEALGALLEWLAECRKAVETELSSLSPSSRYEEVDSSLREKWEDELSAAVEAEYRRRRSDFIGALQWLFRDVWLLSRGDDQGLLSLPRLREASKAIATRIGPEEALENLENLIRTQRLLETNVQEALVLEVGLLRLRA